MSRACLPPRPRPPWHPLAPFSPDVQFLLRRSRVLSRKTWLVVGKGGEAGGIAATMARRSTPVCPLAPITRWWLKNSRKDEALRVLPPSPPPAFSVRLLLLSDCVIGTKHSVSTMLRLGCRRTLRVVLRGRPDAVRAASSSAGLSHQPNAPLELDPAFQALLKDVEISIRNRIPDTSTAIRGPRELELIPHGPDVTHDYLTSAELDAQDSDGNHADNRKSPAASFGSQRIGAVVLPLELQLSIERLIAGACSSTPTPPAP